MFVSATPKQYTEAIIGNCLCLKGVSIGRLAIDIINGHTVDNNTSDMRDISYIILFGIACNHPGLKVTLYIDYIVCMYC